jgi:ribosomal protein L19E
MEIETKRAQVKPLRKTGTVHKHVYSALQKNWQGRTFDQCLFCGAMFFVD